MGVDIQVTIKGPLFSPNVVKRIAPIIQAEIINKLVERMTRVPKSAGKRFKTGKKAGRMPKGGGMGVVNNTLTPSRPSILTAQVRSTLNEPRTVGTKWEGYNVAIAKSMVPRVARKAVERIAQELNNG